MTKRENRIKLTSATVHNEVSRLNPFESRMKYFHNNKTAPAKGLVNMYRVTSVDFRRLPSTSIFGFNTSKHAETGS